MPLNVGYIAVATADVSARIYYDAAFSPIGPDQPLTNGPRGYCLDMTNVSGAKADVTVVRDDGTTTQVRVGQGDPVTTGPASGRSRTVAQLNALGFFTRGDVNLTITG